MSELHILNNIGNKGLIIDQVPWTLSGEYISYGRNFRIDAGSIFPKGGKENLATAPADINNIGHIFNVGNIVENFWVLCGRDEIYAWDGTTFFDIGSVASYTGLGVDDELLWSHCLLGKIPIINNPQSSQGPEYWGPVSGSQPLQSLAFDATNTWAAKGYSCQVFRAHRNYLFALNLTEGATDLPETYRWSHPADINSLPATWDETDDAFLAGKASLGGDMGNILDGLSLRDSFVIYSEKGINVLDSTGDEYVFRRRKLSSTFGLLSRNCVVEVKGAHFLLADSDIIYHDGNTIDSLAHNRVKKDLFSRLNDQNYDRCYALRNDKEKEVWFCIPETESDYPNLAYIYNWKEDSWAIRDLPVGMPRAGYGYLKSFGSTIAWNNIGTNWNTETRPWNASSETPLDATVIGATNVAREVMDIETISPDSDIDFIVERQAFPLVDDRQVTTIVNVYPHIEGGGLVDVQFGSHDYPDSPIRWKPVMRFDPANDRKLSLRTTGELHAWRFKSVDAQKFNLTGMTIEFERSGLR